MRKNITGAFCALAIVGLVGCSDDPTTANQLALSGSFSLVAGKIPRVSDQTRCNITREAGGLTINGSAYSLQYEEDEACSVDSKVTYGFTDAGTLTVQGTALTFKSSSAGNETFTGSLEGTDVVANLKSFGTVRYRH